MQTNLLSTSASSLDLTMDLLTRFRGWLTAGGYSSSAVRQYCLAVRLTLTNRTIDNDDISLNWLDLGEADLPQRKLAVSTQQTYRKGLRKLRQFLKTTPSRNEVNWTGITDGLPGWLVDHLRDYLAFCTVRWPVARRDQNERELLSHLCGPLRWMAAQQPLTSVIDLTPEVWFAYLDDRLDAGTNPVTLNSTLCRLKGLLFFPGTSRHLDLPADAAGWPGKNRRAPPTRCSARAAPEVVSGNPIGGELSGNPCSQDRPNGRCLVFADAA